MEKNSTGDNLKLFKEEICPRFLKSNFQTEILLKVYIETIWGENYEDNFYLSQIQSLKISPVYSLGSTPWILLGAILLKNKEENILPFNRSLKITCFTGFYKFVFTWQH